MASITQQELDRGWYFNVQKKDGTPSGWIMTTLNGLTAWGDCGKMRAAFPNGTTCSSPAWVSNYKLYNPGEFRAWLAGSGLPLSQKAALYSGPILLGIGVLAVVGIVAALMVARKKKLLMFKAPDTPEFTLESGPEGHRVVGTDGFVSKWFSDKARAEEILDMKKKMSYDSPEKELDELGNPVSETAWIEAILANDEESTDAELIEHFQKNGLSLAEADAWVAKRQDYLLALHAPKKSKNLAVLNSEQEKSWEKAMEYYMEEGWNDDEAGEQAWQDLIAEFPDLKKFTGIDDKKTMASLKKAGYYSSPAYDEVGQFYVVTKATPNSTLDDVMFPADVPRMMLQSLGGLREDEIVGIYKDPTAAKKAAEFQLSEPAVAVPGEAYEAPKVPTRADVEKLYAYVKGFPKPKGWDNYYNNNMKDKIDKIAKGTVAVGAILGTGVVGAGYVIASKKSDKIKDLNNKGLAALHTFMREGMGRVITLGYIYLQNGRDPKRALAAIKHGVVAYGAISGPDISIDWPAINKSKLNAAMGLLLDDTVPAAAAAGGAATSETGVGAGVGGGVAATTAPIAGGDNVIAFKLILDAIEPAIVLKNKPEQ